jgi:hypothetical protein
MDVPQLVKHLENVELVAGDTLHYRIWDGSNADDLSLLVHEPRMALNINPLVKSESVYMLSPLNSSRKARQHGIKLKFWVSEAMPHKPVKIEVQTRYGDVELTRYH